MLYASWLMLWLGGSLFVGSIARSDLVVIAEIGWFFLVSGYVMLHARNDEQS